MRKVLASQVVRVLGVVFAGALMGLGLSPGAAAAPGDVPPNADPFYQPPAPLPAGNPGDVIRSRTFTALDLGGGPLPVTAYQFMYLSTDQDGTRIPVTGTLLVPLTTWSELLLGPRPVIVYPPGTHGLGDTCAPSYWWTKGIEYEGHAVTQLLALGYAVVMTDYEGLGTPGTHSYVVGDAQGRATLDSARAASRVPGAGLHANAPMVIWSYSQGGQSAAWAGELQPSYAPELNLKGVAAGGVPGDLQVEAQYLEQQGALGLEVAALIGYDAAYPELPLHSYLTPLGAELLPVVAEKCALDPANIVSGTDTIDGALGGHTFGELFKQNPRLQPPYATRFGENAAGQHKPRVPMYLYHSPADELVAYDAGWTTFQRYCRLGAQVEWHDTSVQSTHLVSAAAQGPEVVEWITGRLAGLPSGNSC